MSAVEGRRVVLIMAREGGLEGSRLGSALAEIEQGGYELVAVVDPAQRLDALRMVLDGLADLVVLISPEDFPVRYAADLNNGGRVRPALRPAADRQQAHPDRRPRLVDATEEPAPDRRVQPVGRRPVVLPRDRRTQVIRRSA